MDIVKISGILMITGFVFLVGSGVIAPPGVYRETEFGERLKIIENHQTRWSATNAIGALGALSTSAGFLLLSVHLWKSQNQILVFLGAAAFSISGIAITIQSYRRVVDPALHLASASPLERVWLWSLLAAILVFGFIFLQAGYPTWLGYLSIGSAVLLGIGAVVSNLALAEVAYLIPVIAAIVILRRP